MKILITGATSGLGYSLSCELAKKGHIVYAASKNEKETFYLDQKAKNDKVILFPIVLNLLDDLEKYQEFLDVDCLILQAGIGEGGHLSTIDISKVEENYEVNVFSNLRVLQAYISCCEKKKRKGKIFVTSSLLAYVPFPSLGSYGSTKAALSYLVKTLQCELELESKNISLTLVEPGAYHTGFNQVMLDNQLVNQKEVTSYDLFLYSVEKFIFVLIESFSYTSFVDKMVKEIEKERPKKKIQIPKRQSFFVQMYQFLSLLKDF